MLQNPMMLIMGAGFLMVIAMPYLMVRPPSLTSRSIRLTSYAEERRPRGSARNQRQPGKTWRYTERVRERGLQVGVRIHSPPAYFSCITLLTPHAAFLL